MKGMEMEFVHPDEELLRSYLMIFRLFMLKKEPIHLNRIYNICHKVITSEKIRGYLIDSRKHWKESQKSTGIKIKFNNREMTPEYVMDLLINGYYFHNDTEKYQELSKYMPYVQMIAKNQFLFFLKDATQQILYLNHIIKFCLREDLINDSISGT